jgi:hypothetical protein
VWRVALGGFVAGARAEQACTRWRVLHWLRTRALDDISILPHPSKEYEQRLLAGVERRGDLKNWGVLGSPKVMNTIETEFSIFSNLQVFHSCFIKVFALPYESAYDAPVVHTFAKP